MIRIRRERSAALGARQEGGDLARRRLSFAALLRPLGARLPERGILAAYAHDAGASRRSLQATMPPHSDAEDERSGRRAGRAQDRPAAPGPIVSNGLRWTVTVWSLATASSTTARSTGSRMIHFRRVAERADSLSLRPAVQALAHVLAGLEEGHVFLRDDHLLAGARIAAGARRPVLHREGAEAAQLHPVAARQRRHDLLQDGVHDVLHIALEKVRIARGNALDELRFDHAGPPSDRIARNT